MFVKGNPDREKTTLPLRKMRFSTIRINVSSIHKRSSYSKENFWIGTTTLIFSNKDLNDIMKKIVKSLKGASFLIKCVSEKVEKEIKKQKKLF